MSGSGSPRYKGVRMRKWGKWVSEVREPHRRANARTNRIWLGSFRSPEEAAHAYDAALLCCRGRTAANLNFPNFDYRIPPGTVGSYSIREIQAAAAAAAAQYSGRPFSYNNFMCPQADSNSSSDDDDDDDDNAGGAGTSNAVEDITYDDSADAGPSQSSWGGNNWSPYDDPGLQGSAPPPNYDDDDDSDDDSDDDDEPRLWP